MSRARGIVIGACGLVVALLFLVERQPDPERGREKLAQKPAAPRIVVVAQTSRVERVALGRLFLIAADGDERSTAAALSAALERLDELDRRLSEWRPGSDVWAINARAGRSAALVDADTRALLARAISLSAETGGSYDPTIGALAALWPFGDPSRPLPRRSDIERALAHVDVSRLIVSATRASLTDPEMRLALGGLEVGYAMQEIMTLLAQRGVRRAVVRAGRDVLSRGSGDDALGTIVVVDPRWPERTLDRFTVVDRAVSIIDDTRGALVRRGVVLAPVLDPATGEPARGCRSVVVVAPDPVAARAYATAIFVMGPERGLAWAEDRAEIAASIVDGDGRARRTSSWERLTRPVAIRAEAPPETAAPPPRDPARTTPARPPAPDPRRMTDRDLVTIDGFRLDRTEVTNAEYTRFLEAERRDPHAFCHPSEPSGHDHTPRYFRRFSPRLTEAGSAGALAPFDSRTFRDPGRPVVGVDFWDAFAFARWSGKRLPTRLELERACRGPDGRRWPFGDVWNPRAANTGGERDGERDGHTYAAPADSFAAGASAEGCLHLAGNVAEWTVEGWVIGGSSRSNPSGVACGAGRSREPAFRAFDLGFRCAVDGER